MTESEFLLIAEQTLQQIQSALDRLDEDWDVDRLGNVLTVEFDDGFQIVMNKQTPTRQIWLASRKGGMHFQYQDGRWLEENSQKELFEQLSSLITLKLGHRIELECSCD